MAFLQASSEKLSQEKRSRIYTLVNDELTEVGVLPKAFTESNVLYFCTTKEGLKLESTISLKRGEYLCHGMYVLENCEGRIFYQVQESFVCTKNAHKKAEEEVVESIEAAERTVEAHNTSDLQDLLGDEHCVDGSTPQHSRRRHHDMCELGSG